MQRILEIIKELKQDYNDESNVYDIGLLDELEKEVKEYQKIANHYRWNVILNIQKDYRKARAFEIVKNKYVNLKILSACEYVADYNYYTFDADRHLTQEEFDTIQRGIE